MGRTIVRVFLGLLGAGVLLVGGTAALLGGWISTTLTAEDFLRTAPESIDVSRCSTVVMEIADVRVDAGELTRIEPIADRAQSRFTLRVNAVRDESWLVGMADQKEVEDRLLGARYCLVESLDSGWEVTAIAVDPNAPDAQFAGVPGLWATAMSGEVVAIPLPESGSSVVISGSNESSMESIDVAGELEISGASTVGWVALIGGIVTAVLGIVLLLISIVSLRSKGRHEGHADTGVSA